MKKAGRIKVGDNDADVVPAFDGHAHAILVGMVGS